MPEGLQTASSVERFSLDAAKVRALRSNDPPQRQWFFAESSINDPHLDPHLLTDFLNRLPIARVHHLVRTDVRLRAVEAATAKAETLCAGRFTAADIVIGYALRLAENIGLAKDFGPNVAAYWTRLQQREGFKRAVAAEQKAGVEQNIAPRVRA